jgi:hypothetical protein
VAHTNIQSYHGADKIFADARYTVDSGAVLTKPTAKIWPFLQFSQGTDVQIPLKIPLVGNRQEGGLLAATAPAELGRVDLGQACTGPPCLPSLN